MFWGLRSIVTGIEKFLAYLKKLTLIVCSKGSTWICVKLIRSYFERDKFTKQHCPKNDLKREAMKNIPYANVVGSLMYA